MMHLSSQSVAYVRATETHTQTHTIIITTTLVNIQQLYPDTSTIMKLCSKELNLATLEYFYFVVILL